MPISREKLGNEEQAKLFPRPKTTYPAALDCDLTLRLLISDAIASSSKSRDQIADEMSYLVGSVKITTPMLNCYTAESKEKHRFPLAFLPAFCQVTADYRAMEYVARVLGLALVNSEDAQLLGLARKLVEKEMTEREFNGLRDQIVAQRSNR